MYLLAEIFPFLRRWPMPFNRDQMILLMVAFNELMLGVDTYLAHSISGNIVLYEWIPIVFGIISGGLLLVAGLVAIRRQMLANWIGSGVFLASAAVGLLGMYFHLNRDFLTNALPGSQWVTSLILYGPPLICPITFALVGWMGMSAAWEEVPIDSGLLHLWGNLHLKMPLSKTRAYFLITSLFMSVTLISSVLDHARTNFVNPWLWLPTMVGVFATLATFAMGFFENLKRSDVITFITAMGLMILVGMIGFVLHIERNLVHEGVIVGERFIRGAPFLAPLLFANMGSFGLLLLMDPKAGQKKKDDDPLPTTPGLD
jgi:hypothetical protein